MPATTKKVEPTVVTEEKKVTPVKKTPAPTKKTTTKKATPKKAKEETPVEVNLEMKIDASELLDIIPIDTLEDEMKNLRTIDKVMIVAVSWVFLHDLVTAWF